MHEVDAREQQRKVPIDECNASEDRCMRKWTERSGVRKVENRCSDRHRCIGEKKACEDMNGKSKLSCCDKSECNAGSALFDSVFLLTVCSVLTLALLK